MELMALQYNDEMKGLITLALEDAFKNGRSSPYYDRFAKKSLYELPQKLVFDGREYTPAEFLTEVKKKSMVGEQILQHMYDSAREGLEYATQHIQGDQHQRLRGTLIKVWCTQEMPKLLGFTPCPELQRIESESQNIESKLE